MWAPWRLLDRIPLRWRAVALTGLLIACAQWGALTRSIDNALFAARALTIQRQASGDLVLVAIDTHSIEQAGQWPWPRERFARAIANLHAAGANLIAFDVDFSAGSAAEDDAALRTAIDEAAGRIVLPTFLQPGARTQNTPLAALSQNALLASVNVELDSDGLVRRYYRGFDADGAYRPSLATVLSDRADGDTSPFLIDFGIRTEGLRQLSFEDIYGGHFDPSLVQGKIVLIGATAMELRDDFATPVAPSMPGVTLHALAYESIIQHRALTRLSDGVIIVLVFIWLAAFWPRGGVLALPRFAVVHTMLAAALIGATFALQAVAPVSADIGALLLAQILCFGAGVVQELRRRAHEIERERHARAVFVAYHDPETELSNRRALLDRLSQELIMTNAVGVVVIGIDRFSTLRGAIGYGNANRVVRTLAQAISAARGDATTYHLSTSILAVIVSGETEGAARAASHALLDAIDSGADLDGAIIDLTLRAGVAIAMGGEGSAETLLERASLALDQARIKHRRCVAFDPARAPDSRVQLALLSDMRAGLERGEFSLLYQPKASARDGRIVGAEALLRWRHPVHGVISPDLFIPVAEETGAIEALTRWVCMRAVEDQAELKRRGLDLTLAVNLSGRTLSDRDFSEFLIDAVRRAGAKLCVEITETAIIDEPEAAVSAVGAYKAAGIRVSIDDYGAGLSSLSYLKQIHAHELKLDKSLVRDAPASARDRLILKSTIDLAHGLGMSVVAEGIEDEVTRAVLCGLGCNTIQGYLIAPGLALDDLAAFCGARPTAESKQRCSGC